MVIYNNLEEKYEADVIRTEVDGSYWVTCWNCGGEGFHDGDCECGEFEDTCCCAEPTPPLCRECRGKGALHIQAQTEAST